MKKTFETGDMIGRYVIDEFAGTNNKREPAWWVTENGEPKIVTEKKLRAEIAHSEWTPEKIRKLSARAYDELRREIGEDTIDEILGTTQTKQTVEKPPAQRQYEICAKWFEAHPQIPQTKTNVRLFDQFLGELANPTFTSRDFDLAFEELFPQLELNPTKAGIEGFGDAIRGETANKKFTAAQIQQLQKAFSVKVPVDFSKLSENEILAEVAKTTTADGFIQYTREVDREKGVAAPLPPAVQADLDRSWRNFFQLHPEISPTDEIKAKLWDVLTKNGLPVQTQYLSMALDSLLEAGDPSVTKQESGVYKAGRSQWVVNEPRPKSPSLVDNSPVTVTIAEINALDAKTYGERLKNPQFVAAVEALTGKSAS